MEHYEIHLITEPNGVQSALSAGLLDSPENLSCAHCEEIVGEDLDDFYPFAIVLDSFDDVWFVCDECYTPVLDPQAF
jgi:hypothetical protein